MNETNVSPATPLLPPPPPNIWGLGTWHSGDTQSKQRARFSSNITKWDQVVHFQATLQDGTRQFSFKPHYKTGPASSVSSHITKQDHVVMCHITKQIATLQNRTRQFSFKLHYKTGPCGSVSSHITRQDQPVQFQATLQNRTRWFSFKPHYKTAPGGSVLSHITRQGKMVQFLAAFWEDRIRGLDGPVSKSH